MAIPVPSSMESLNPRSRSRLSILSTLALVSMDSLLSSMSNHGDMDSTAPGSGAFLRCSVRARFTAKFPPIESPELAIRDGSYPWPSSHRYAASTSSICAGNLSSGASR